MEQNQNIIKRHCERSEAIQNSPLLEELVEMWMWIASGYHPRNDVCGEFSELPFTAFFYTIIAKKYTFVNRLKDIRKFLFTVYQSNTEFFKLDFRFIVRLARDLYIAKNCYKNWLKSEMKKWFAENKVLNHYNFLESFCVYNNINVYLTK